MSYHEKRALSGIITVLLMAAGYCLYTFGTYASGSVGRDDLKFWVAAELIFIAAGAIVTAATQILLSLNEYAQQNKTSPRRISALQKIKEVTAEDEMDHLIALKTAKISYAFTGFGFIAGLVTVLTGCSASVMVNILFFSVCAGSLAEGAAVFYYYKVGVTNA
ncbi:MAG: hypothetical protein QM689_01835 [Oscillospiraceae bacterium]